MKVTTQIAKHLREVFFGGNWTVSNVKTNLDGVSWQQATTQVHDFNTIATLAYHIQYYVVVTIEVLEGNPLNAKDEYSFAHPPISTQSDWTNFLGSATDCMLYFFMDMFSRKEFLN